MAAPSPPNVTPPRSSRLSVDDWLDAGLEVLTTEGIRGVKITRLCDRLQVTKGSFYWHFTDLDAYLTALAAYWGAGRDRDRHDLHRLRDEEPATRIVGAMQLFVDRRIARLDQAMREWGRGDDRARTAVAASDRFVFRFVRDAFVEVGFDERDADLRAELLYCSGVGYGLVGRIGMTRPLASVPDALDLLMRR